MCGKPIGDDFEVVRLLRGGQAIVSLKGLCLLVAQPTGRVVFEFVDRECAHWNVAEQICNHNDEWIEAIDYENGKLLNFDNRGLSDDPRERSYQLHYFTSSRHDGEDTVKMQRKFYHRAKGFKLGQRLRVAVGDAALCGPRTSPSL